MVQLEEAVERILAAIAPLDLEAVPIAEAAARIAARDCAAPADLPRFDNSAMDGYAVRSQDLRNASATAPVSLKIIASVPAGAQATAPIATGTCARIFTGSMLPPGADAVVMQEDVREAAGALMVSEPLKPWENVRFRGEDVKAGAVVVRPGERISAGAIGLLGALGFDAITVHCQPRVSVLSTGNELREPGKALAPGQIYESNCAMLGVIVRNAGGRPVLLPPAADTPETVAAALKEAFDRSDMVITSGGVSVGEYDFVKEAFRKLGGELDFWRVAVRPGKPFVFGRWGSKYLFGLPGNPVSAFVTATLLVRPAILRLQGATDVALPTQLVTASEAFVNRGDRRHFMRARIDGAGNASLPGVQAAHVLSSLARANALVDVPPNTVLEKGSAVRALRFDC